MASKSLPSQSQVVIVGGGIIGCSIAYHLTKLGWKDVIVLERDRLTCGTTWHAAGLITSLRHTDNQTRLACSEAGRFVHRSVIRLPNHFPEHWKESSANSE